jgi:hypothetical protein
MVYLVGIKSSSAVEQAGLKRQTVVGALVTEAIQVAMLRPRQPLPGGAPEVPLLEVSLPEVL